MVPQLYCGCRERHFNTHSLAGVYGLDIAVFCKLHHFNTHSLAGVYGADNFPHILSHISILTPLRECMCLSQCPPEQNISILTPLRECMVFSAKTFAAMHFNTHSLAGVYAKLSFAGDQPKFQYSLPCGSV